MLPNETFPTEFTARVQKGFKKGRSLNLSGESHQDLGDIDRGTEQQLSRLDSNRV